MLILSRKEGEKVLIGPQIEVVVTEIRGSSVRLGFRAPCEVAIHREEIHHRLIAECKGLALERQAG